MIVSDSYIAMLLPDDITPRISEFLAGTRTFPFVERDELMCVMYLYGRSARVSEEEIEEVNSLAQRTASQLAQEIDIYANSSPAKLDPEYIRSKYINRQLQLAVENKPERIAGDPAIISDCFAQHVVYHKQDYFLELYGPLKNAELTSDIRPLLEGRMVMICYNRKDASDIGLAHPLIPVYVWFRDQAGAKP
ncbi:MAG TPA: hypothetical protein VNI77_11915 [Nitrososphaera sp.]|nr:hypothetical protein [Nitrososphaera sp.]